MVLPNGTYFYSNTTKLLYFMRLRSSQFLGAWLTFDILHQNTIVYLNKNQILSHVNTMKLFFVALNLGNASIHVD